MGRWAGIDYGKRRIGVALSDAGPRIASPMTTLDATGSTARDAHLVLRWATENAAGGIVVGLPLNMDGSLGTQAQVSRDLAVELRCLGNLPVELWDERLSSFQADELMQAAGLTSAIKKRQRDALAAQVILQSFLDARQPRTQPPEDGRPT